MSYMFHRPLLGMILILGIVGCSNRGTVALSGTPTEIDLAHTPEVASSGGVASPVVTAAVTQVSQRGMPAPPTQLVSATSPQNSSRRALMTLPPGGDLMSQIRNASGPVVLDFYATWCGPCRVQGEILHEVETAAAQSNALIIKIDVDQHADIASELGIQSLPTLMVVRNGKVVHQKTGVASKHQLVEWMR